MNKKILVIGSISIDNVTYTNTLPEAGTTVFGESFFSNIGGKGANQACASYFLGGNVSFFGAVGNDSNGDYAINFIRKQGLNAIIKRKDCSTGVATIIIDNQKAENRIVIVPGANLAISKEDIDEIDFLFNEADYLLIQLENDIEVVKYALMKAKEKGLITILNPAPYHHLDESIFPYIDYFVPNEHEMDSYTSPSLSRIEQAREILSLGVNNVIVTLGEKGSILVNKDTVINIEANKVDAVDTTGAGDSYLGALVTSLSYDNSVEDAMKFASKASSITVTKKGAVVSLPHLEDLN